MIQKSDIYIKIFLLILLLIKLAIVVNSQASCTINIEDVNIPEKSKTWGNLMIYEVSNLGSFSINLSWDPSIVNIEKISGSDFTIIPYFNNHIGFVNITGFTFSVVNGYADIADILFEAIGDSGNSCFLKITHCRLFTADPLPEIINCSYDENLTTITITEAMLDNNKNDTKQEENKIFWYAFIIIVIIVLIIIGATISWKRKSQNKPKSKKK